jgi:hypothetical protein
MHALDSDRVTSPITRALAVVLYSLHAAVGGRGGIARYRSRAYGALSPLRDHGEPEATRRADNAASEAPVRYPYASLPATWVAAKVRVCDGPGALGHRTCLPRLVTGRTGRDVRRDGQTTAHASDAPRRPMGRLIEVRAPTCAQVRRCDAHRLEQVDVHDIRSAGGG